MSEAFSIADLRRELRCTLAEMAARVGIRSIGHMSDIERGAPCSVAVALRIEALAEGRIRAADLSADVALVEAARSWTVQNRAGEGASSAEEAAA